MKNHKKEITMENYFEVKEVSQATEIKKAYEEAVKANAPKYRAVSKTNQYYGWDEKTNKFVKAEIGQEWFDNPHYVAPIEEIVEEPIEKVEEIKTEEVVVKNATTEEIDYKALYEEEVEKNSNKDQEIVSLRKENEELKSENKCLEDELSETQDELDEIKETITKFKKLFA